MVCLNSIKVLKLTRNVAFQEKPEPTPFIVRDLFSTLHGIAKPCLAWMLAQPILS